MRRDSSGQSLVECALLLPLYASLALAVLAYGQWYAIRRQLLSAAREGAFLYSSGRLDREKVRAMVQRALAQGFPALRLPLEDIHIGRRGGAQARLWRLDEVAVSCPPTRFMKLFRIKEMTETCVIKHAPSYWQTEMPIPGASLGPPESW